MKKFWKITLIIIVLVSGFVGYKYWKKQKNKPEWKLEEARYSTIREVVTASGTINPVTKVEVGTEVSGKIEKIYKDYNQSVRKGDLLAKIDTETLELNLQEIESSLLAARSSARDAQIDVDLLTELVGKNMAAEYELQKAQIKLEQAQQAVTRAQLSFQKAQKNLQNAHIYSPIDGVIISRAVDEGQTVAASLNAPTLFVIANDLTKMQIEASVDEADVGRISLGMPVIFNADAFMDERFSGTVKQVRLFPKSESNVVTYSVIIDVDNPDMLLLPGMTANVTIIVNQKSDILTVPSRALQFKPSKEVWESFGLTWNDSLLVRQRGGMPGQMRGQQNRGNIAQDSTKSKGQQKQGMQRDRSKGRDMNKTAQRKDHVESKGAVDVFKLRNAYNATKIQNGFVWVIENKVPKSIPVVTSMSDGNTVEIVSGLEEGQSVIVGVTTKDTKKNNQNNMMRMGMRM
ncbi:MAG TPA: efflux RND transporter periplasmic adaptor subunit [Candidatus Cloacimonadota bacterium]|nr:efflux RND transporter periplasmic adaptor subunit [Candidatus Cloacimonadota bacterium]